MFSMQDCQASSQEKVDAFLQSNAALINEISNQIITKMSLICRKMTAIKIYAKDDDVQNETVYNPLMSEIQAYFDFIHQLPPHSTMTDPFLIKAFKKQLYLTLFSSFNEKTLEMLFCVQALDSDVLLGCTRRANQCSKTDNRQLFLFDINMCKELIDQKVPIQQVVNLGIIHHYLPLDLDAVLGTQPMKTTCDPQIKQAVIDVIQYIPLFISTCLSQTDHVKVVLRSCYGVELPGEEKIPALKETKAYPIRIKVLDQKTLTESELKKNIIIQQQMMRYNQCVTKLYLPVEGAEPITLNEDYFPELTGPESFTQFAQALIQNWPTLNKHIPHINPFSIKMDYSSDIHKFGLNRYMLEQGLKSFKKVFIDALEEWDVDELGLKAPKIKYNSIFTTTITLKDVTAMPVGSYAQLLLDLIKENPCVAEFKAYYADYRAGPDRTILAMDRDGMNASCPKAVEVSRDTMWGVVDPVLMLTGFKTRL